MIDFLKKPFSARELNYRIKIDWDRKLLVSTEDFLRKQNIHIQSISKGIMKFLPILIVVNANSKSTPLRQCVIPNRPTTFEVTCQELIELGYSLKENEDLNTIKKFCMTWNDCIIQYSTQLPDIQYYNISYLMSGTEVVADISDFFKRILYATETALSQQVLYYVNKDGEPTITTQDQYKTTAKSFVYIAQTYGQADSPISSQIALMMGVTQYEKFGQLTILPLIKLEINHWLKKIYVDDFGLFPNLDNVIKFMIKMPSIINKFPCDMTCPNMRNQQKSETNKCICSKYNNRSNCLCCNIIDDRTFLYNMLIDEITNKESEITEVTKARSHILHGTCSICNTKMVNHQFTFHKTPIIPFNCPVIKNTAYIKGNKNDNKYSIGYYRQELTGLENLLIMLMGDLEVGLLELATSNYNDLTEDDKVKYVTEKLSKLSNLEYTMLTKAVSKHYVLIIMYNLQLITRFCNFYFKELLSSNRELQEILPYFLIEDLELKHVKANLQDLRPPVEEIFKELITGSNRKQDDILQTEEKSCTKKFPKQQQTQIEDISIQSIFPLYCDKCKCIIEEETKIRNPYEMDLLIYYNNIFLDIESIEDTKNTLKHCFITKEENVESCSQLGRSFYSDNSLSRKQEHHQFGTLGLSKRHQGVKLVQIHTKNNIIHCTTFEEACYILDSPCFKFSKHTFLKLMSQLFDFAGHYHVPLLMLSKTWWGAICRNEEILTWDSVLSDTHVNYAKIFVEYFFISCKQQIPRGTCLLHPNTKRTMLICSDAGAHLYGFSIFIISQISDSNGAIINADYTVILQSTMTSPKNWTIPQTELLALSKSIFVSLKIIHFLQTEGMDIYYSNIIFSSDSSVAISQSRFVGAECFVQKRVSALVAKIQLAFVDNKLCLISQIRYWDQSKHTFPADSLTKFQDNSSKLITDLTKITTTHLKQIQDKSTKLDKNLLYQNIDDWTCLKIQFSPPKIDELGIIPHLVQNRQDCEKYTYCTKTVNCQYCLHSRTNGHKTNPIYDLICTDEKINIGGIYKINLNTNDNTWIDRLQQFFEKKLQRNDYLGTNWRIKGAFTDAYYERFVRCLYIMYKLQMKILKKEKFKTRFDKLCATVDAQHEKLMRNDPNTRKLVLKNGLDFPGGVTSDIDIQQAIDDMFHQAKLNHKCTKLIFQDWEFSSPYTTYKWADTLSKVAYMFVTEYICLIWRLKNGASFEHIKSILFKYINYHFLTVLDQISPWSKDFWKKYGRHFCPINVERKKYYLDKNNKLCEHTSFFKIQILLSREQRDLITPELIHGPIYKMFTSLDKNGSFSKFLCKSVHSTTHLASWRIHDCILLNRGFWILHPNNVFQDIKHSCALCRVKQAVSLSDKYLTQKHTKSGSLDIFTFLQKPGLFMKNRFSILDLCGPFFVRTDKFNTKMKIWICLYLDLKSHILQLSPIFSLSSEAIICNVNTYCLGNSGTIFIADSGSNYTGSKREITVKNLETNNINPLKNDFEEISASLDTNKISFLLVPAKHHQAIGRVERMVWSVKRIFAETGIYMSLREGHFTIDQFTYIINKTAYIINTRPLIIAQHGSIITPLTLQSITHSNPFLLEKNIQIQFGLNNIIENINNAIFTNMFKKNILDMKQNYRSRLGSNIQTIKVDDIVFDKFTYNTCKNYVSSIYKVIYINVSQTWLLLSRPRSTIMLTKRYIKKYGKYTLPKDNNLKNNKQYKSCIDNNIIISRSIGDIYLIANKIDDNTIIFEKPYLGDLFSTENANTIEKHLCKRNEIYEPSDIRMHPNNDNTLDIDLFKHLKMSKFPSLILPKNHQKAENLNNLTDFEATVLLKSMFDSEKNLDPQKIFDSEPNDSDEDMTLIINDEQYPEVEKDTEIEQVSEEITRLVGKRLRSKPDRLKF